MTEGVESPPLHIITDVGGGRGIGTGYISVTGTEYEVVHRKSTVRVGGREGQGGGGGGV